MIFSNENEKVEDLLSELEIVDWKKDN